MFIEIIAIILSFTFACVISFYANKFREKVLELRRTLVEWKNNYTVVVNIARDKKKLTRDRVKEIREYDDNKNRELHT